MPDRRTILPAGTAQGVAGEAARRSHPPRHGRPVPRVAGRDQATGPEPGSNFTYSAKLTEIILLGVLAQRFNTRIEWDAKAGRITNHPELNAFVKEPARKGWEYGEDLWRNKDNEAITENRTTSSTAFLHCMLSPPIRVHAAGEQPAQGLDRPGRRPTGGSGLRDPGRIRKRPAPERASAYRSLHWAMASSTPISCRTGCRDSDGPEESHAPC